MDGEVDGEGGMPPEVTTTVNVRSAVVWDESPALSVTFPGAIASNAAEQLTAQLTGGSGRQRPTFVVAHCGWSTD